MVIRSHESLAAAFAPGAVDPATAAVNAALLAERATTPQVHEVGAVRLREIRHRQAIATSGVPSPLAVERKIGGRGGTVPARFLVPEQVDGVYLHIHGGGFCLGESLASDPRNEEIVRGCRLAVVSLDYRLAPEHPYPAGPDDCETAALWLIEHARAELGSERLLIGGDSAGATLAVTTLLRLRDRHGFRGFSGAALNFGVYDLNGTPSVTALSAGSPTLTGEAMLWFADHYLPAGADWREPDVSPLFADLSGLPPALFTVGTIDPLLDDSLFMHARWLAAGNDAELAVYAGGPHGFTSYATPIARGAKARIDRFLTGSSGA